jgi:hypothetical protein
MLLFAETAAITRDRIKLALFFFMLPPFMEVLEEGMSIIVSKKVSVKKFMFKDAL